MLQNLSFQVRLFIRIQVTAPNTLEVPAEIINLKLLKILLDSTP